MNSCAANSTGLGPPAGAGTVSDDTLMWMVESGPVHFLPHSDNRTLQALPESAPGETQLRIV
jgi:hypothetical protein